MDEQLKRQIEFHLANKKLERLVELSIEFRKAVESALEQDVQIQQKILESVKPEEMKSIQSLLQQVASESLDFMHDSTLGLNHSHSFLKKNLELSEITADLFLRVEQKETVASFIPAALKNEKDAEALKKAGAPKIASLCV